MVFNQVGKSHERMLTNGNWLVPKVESGCVNWSRSCICLHLNMIWKRSYSELPDRSPLNAPLPPEVDPLCTEEPTRARCSCRNLNTSLGGGRACVVGISSSSTSAHENTHTIWSKGQIFYLLLGWQRMTVSIVYYFKTSAAKWTGSSRKVP
jgi:hypothetical protein